MVQEIPKNLANILRSLLGVLGIDNSSILAQEILTVCDSLKKPAFRIAVFGPFNYGKSTLLNALLGQRTLPMDLIPTTGAAILVRYGEKLYCRITLSNQEMIEGEGLNLLKQYAILDENRRMRPDVTAVDVFFPHPFLQTGVEFLDLPGTDDHEAQEELVKNHLLTADLIVQLLDARKLMTLGEREHLRDWLLDRGINTVVFVVNFLNLLEPDDQKQVHNRLRFLAESFRAQLPPGVSNLYRVDALPALRARLKGDTAAAQIAGLTTFESALQTIAAAQQSEQKTRLPRLLSLVEKLQQIQETKRQAILAEIDAQIQKHQQKLDIKRKAQQLIDQGLQKHLSEFSGWLYLPKLLDNYQNDLAAVLQEDTFYLWEEQVLKPKIIDFQAEIQAWSDRGCLFFEKNNLAPLSIPLPPPPPLMFADSPPPGSNPDDKFDLGSVAIPTGLGWILGGPVGAAVLGGASYVFNKAVTQDNTPTASCPDGQIYREAAADYLTRLSQSAIASLQAYEAAVKQAIALDETPLKPEQTQAYHQLQLLEGIVANLSEALAEIES